MKLKKSMPEASIDGANPVQYIAIQPPHIKLAFRKKRHRFLKDCITKPTKWHI